MNKITPREEKVLARGVNAIIEKAAVYFKEYMYDIAQLAYILDIEAETIEKEIQTIMSHQNDQLYEAKIKLFADVDKGVDPHDISIQLVREEFKNEY